MTIIKASLFTAVSLILLTVSAAFAQSPQPATFTSGRLFSGDGIGDRIPGADSVPAVAVGDFNQDGIADLVTVSYCNTGDTDCAGFSILLGNGDGSFKTPNRIGLAKQNQDPVASTVGDFNGDGNLDVAFRAINPDEVYVYLGNGAGGFTGPNVYAVGVGSNRSGIAAGDVNGDGLLDLVATNTGADTVSVLLGNGDGTFRPPAAYPSACPSPYPSQPNGVAIGDFNGDGLPDIVTTSARTPQGDNGISVLLNNGTGFQPPACFGFGDNSGTARSVATADMNLDGNLDVVLVSWSGATVFLGNGDGTFQTGVNYGAPFSMAIGIGDFNGDGVPDVVLANWRDSIAWVLIGNGDGTLQTAVGYQTDWSADNPLPSVALADLNGDGFLDFIVGNGQGQMVTSVLGNGDGTFRAVRDFMYFGGQAYGLAAANFGGGSPGVALGDGSQGVIVLPGVGDGTLGPPLRISFGSGRYAWDVTAGDVNGDGIPDIVAAPNGGQQVAVVIGNADGTFQAPAFYSTGAGANAQSYEVILADLNGDGSPDIVTSNADGSLSVLLNQGQGTFATAKVIPSLAPNAEFTVAGDFNGDGIPDLAVEGPGMFIYLLLGNGDGTFQTPRTVPTPVNANATLAAGDFNGDGKLDVAVTSVDNSGSLVILTGNGNGTFTAGPAIMLVGNNLQGNARPWHMAVADVNLDGNLDLVISPNTPHVQNCGAFRCAEEYLGLIVYLGNGDGTFTQNTAGPFLVGSLGLSSLAIADFNGDGLPDVALINNEGDNNTSYVAVALNSTGLGGSPETSSARLAHRPGKTQGR